MSASALNNHPAIVRLKSIRDKVDSLLVAEGCNIAEVISIGADIALHALKKAPNNRAVDPKIYDEVLEFLQEIKHASAISLIAHHGEKQ